LIVAVLARAASADDLCARKVHRGAPIDLDVKDADVHDVMRLIADTAKVNLVVSDEVSGKVTLRLKRVAWDLAACTIAKVNHLAVALDDGVLLVTKR
jgi:type IV pilus assembly protein PilQ